MNMRQYYALRTAYQHERQTQGVRTSLHRAAAARGMEFAEAARMLGFTDEFIAASAAHFLAVPPPRPQPEEPAP